MNDAAYTKGKDVGFRAAAHGMTPTQAEIDACAAAYSTDPTAQARFAVGFAAGQQEYPRVSREAAACKVRWR